MTIGGRAPRDEIWQELHAGAYAAAVFRVVATTMATPPLLLWAMRRTPTTASGALPS